ncbi:MAG: hypothetical protein Q8K58_13745 [Acidimicrobiales bacterium]|nr:hypothetical protein [Acidimicrobiales bacterium]
MQGPRRSVHGGSRRVVKAAALIVVGLVAGGAIAAGASLPAFDSGAPTTLCYDNKGVVTRPATGSCPARTTSFSVANPAQIDALDAAINRAEATRLAAERLDPVITVSIDINGVWQVEGRGLYPGHYYGARDQGAICGGYADANGRISLQEPCGTPHLLDQPDFWVYDGMAPNHGAPPNSNGPTTLYNDYGQVVEQQVYCVDATPYPEWAVSFGFVEPCAPHSANQTATN